MKTREISRRNFLRNSALTAGMASLVPFESSGSPLPASNDETTSQREVWIAGFSQMWLRAETADQMVEKMLTILKDVTPLRPDFVCLPEVFPFEMIQKKYTIGEMVELSEKITEQFSNFSRSNNCYTVCPVYTSQNGLNYNSAVFLDKQGKQIGAYHKIHPTWGEIDNGVSPGALFQPVIPTDFGPVSAQICFDINWDDGWTMLKKQGAKIVFWPSAFDGGKMVNTKAWEHKYVVATSTNQNYSKLCDISGETIAQTGIWNKYFFCAPVNLEKVFIHLFPYVNRFQEIYYKYGRKININIFHEEQWAIIESHSPEIFVKDILKEFDILTFEEHIQKGEASQNRVRG
jgi:predicted amidohydrolase